MSRTGDALTLIADDYALAPGVSRAIRELISAGKLSGTSCMTIFDEWCDEAPLLKVLHDEGRAEAGLHLTLTDFAPLSGKGPLGPGSMPPINQLLKAALKGQIDEGAVIAELDAQLDAFAARFGSMPDYLDGHQHVHFLRPVRTWLQRRLTRFEDQGKLPWLRGAPSVTAAPGIVIRAKTALVAVMASGFDRRMRAIGYTVKGPLVGFYDWNTPSDFASMLKRHMESGRGGLFMCHPGFADDMLRTRDRLIAAREAEFACLRDFDFAR